MDVLNQIVEKLNKEEIRNLKLFYRNTGNAGARKDLLLFNYMRNSGPKFSEEKAITKLGYNLHDKNSYYRLKNRLIEDIGDSLSLLHTSKNDLYRLLQFIKLFHIYHARNLYKACLFYLRKAERLALAIENYELLDTVYGNFIRLSADMIDIEPQEYIDKREANAEIVSSLRKMDDILATLSYRLKVSQNFGAQDKTLLADLQQKVKEVRKRTTTGYGKNLEARIYSALSQVLLQQHNYVELEKLVKETYRKFEKEKWFEKSNHELKLQMITYAANALYKNKKFRESLEFADKLSGEIEQYGRLHYEKYLFFYYNLLTLNYAELDKQKGLDKLNEFEQLMRRKENRYYDFYIYLNRAAMLYDMGRYNDALRNLVKLYVSDGYTKADQQFKLKIEVSELIMTFEAGDMEGLRYRIEQVKKAFDKLKKQNRRDFEIINLLLILSNAANYKRDKEIQKQIKTILLNTPANEEDAQIIRYRDWLEAKLA